MHLKNEFYQSSTYYDAITVVAPNRNWSINDSQS